MARLNIYCCGILLALALSPRVTALEQPYLVKQINEQPVNGPMWPYRALERDDIRGVAGDRLYFLFPNDLTVDPNYFGSWSLWSSDATEAGTQKLADWPYTVPLNFEPVPLEGGPLLLVLKDRVLAVQGEEVLEIWLQPTFYGTTYAVVEGGMYFAGTNPLYFTDGTESGTVPIHDFGSGVQVTALANLNGSLYVLVLRQTGASSWAQELWKKADAEADVELIGTFPFPFSQLSRSVLVVAAGRLYFMAPAEPLGQFGTTYIALWVSDGTGDGTIVVDRLNNFFVIDYWWEDYFLPLPEGLLYFDAEYTEEWRYTTGSPESVQTTLVYSRERPLYCDGALYFAVKNAEGTLLYRHEVDREPVLIVQTGKRLLWNPVCSGEGVALVAQDFHHGAALWASDGTAGGLTLIADPAPERAAMYNRTIAFDRPPLSELHVLGDEILFLADDRRHGVELWAKAPGEEARLVKDIQGPSPSAEPIGIWGFLHDTSYLVADDGIHGFEILRTDGTEAGTDLLKDIWPGEKDGFILPGPGQTIRTLKLGNLSFFVADDGVHGNQVWRTDGTPEGTFSPLNIETDLDAYPPELLAVSGGVLYFSIESRMYGRELWRTDGSAAGTQLIADIYPGVEDGVAPGMYSALWDGVFYFVAEDGAHGRELWRTDGTEPGTWLVHDSWIGVTGGQPKGLVAAGGFLYYTAYSPTPDYTLWRTDGTQGGEEPLRLIDVPSNQSGPSQPQFIVVGESLLHVDYQDRLWRADAEGLSEVTLGVEETKYIADPVHLAGRTLLTINYEEGGTEYTSIWITDGTTGGTRELIRTSDGRFYQGLAVGERALYTLDPNASALSKQVWSTDGTESGTYLLVESGTAVQPSGVENAAYLIRRQSPEAPAYLWATDGTASGTQAMAYLGDGSWTIARRDGVLYLLRPGSLEARAGGLYALPQGDIIAPHAADLDANGQISLSELLRVIQFYNLGGFHCAEPGPESEDGYAPGVEEVYFCPPHTSDYNPQDWRITLNELLRAIQFFNSGAVLPCPDAGTEDGFCVRAG